jgi:hypothetical protein
MYGYGVAALPGNDAGFFRIGRFTNIHYEKGLKKKATGTDCKSPSLPFFAG